MEFLVGSIWLRREGKKSSGSLRVEILTFRLSGEGIYEMICSLERGILSVYLKLMGNKII